MSTESYKIFFRENGFCDRLEAISKDFGDQPGRETLEGTKKTVVFDIFDELGYKPKYYHSENFYQLMGVTNGYEFYYHMSCKYGVVEQFFGVTNESTQEHFGTLEHGLCRDGYTEIHGHKIRNSIPYPRFHDLIELLNILKRGLSIYEDFKKAVIDQRPI